MSLHEYGRVVARHWVLVIVVALLVPAAALYLSLSRAPLYEASSELFLSRQDVASALGETTNPNANVQSQLLTTTQARLARIPDVAARALASAGVRGRSVTSFLERSDVSGETEADILDFTVRDRLPKTAERLATAYAEAFNSYTQAASVTSFEDARRDVAAKLAKLRAVGLGRSRLAKTLTRKLEQLQTLQALGGQNGNVVRSARSATRIQPRPVRTLAFAIPLGFILALALAVLAHLLDTRVWSPPEVAHRLRVRLLGRTPSLPRRFRATSILMLRAPSSPRAGAFRVLRASFDLANRRLGARTVMFTSGSAGEGRTTTVSNLAVALARAGRDVVLVDLDFHKPALARRFGLEPGPGVVDVVTGRVELAGALVTVPTETGKSQKRGRGAPPSVELGGCLRILAAGQLPENAPDLMGTPAMARTLDELRDAADLVLIDSPPLLSGGDAIALSAQVDALVIVARARQASRAALTEVRRIVARMPAAALGVVVTAADDSAADDEIDLASLPEDERGLLRAAAS